MTCRLKWGVLIREYNELDYFDLHELKRDACKFYDCIAFKNKPNEQTVIKILEAESHVNNCKRFVKSLCSPQENSLINQEPDNYIEMNENLGRVDLETKQIKEETVKSIRQQGQLVSDDPMIKIQEYIKILKESLDNLAYHPLQHALQKFKDQKNKFYTEKDGTKIQISKDKKLLIYLIYIEVLHYSESMGIPTSQKGKQIIKTLPNKITVSKEND